MLDFDRWLQQQSEKPEQTAPAAAVLTSQLEDQLEDMGFSVDGEGNVLCNCCMCERPIKLTDYISVTECLEADPKDQYCGGSPRCCP